MNSFVLSQDAKHCAANPLDLGFDLNPTNPKPKSTICPVVPQDNRDKRVELLQKYAFKFFPSTKYLNYALRVEEYTLQKAANLVLNVDGCIGTLFLDLLHSSSLFTEVCATASHFKPLCKVCLSALPGGVSSFHCWCRHSYLHVCTNLAACSCSDASHHSL